MTGARLTEDPVPALIRVIAVPAGIGMLFNTLFNIVDSFWAGVWSTEALAALAVSFPIFFVVIAASAGFGQGTTALIAAALGGQRDDEAAALCGQSFLLAVVIGLLLALLLPFAGASATALGADDTTRDLAVAYLVPIVGGAVVFLMASTVNATLTAQGNTRAMRNALAVAALLNVGLDPLLMFGLGPIPAMGVPGIAWATIGLQAVQLIWLASRARRTPLGQRWSSAHLRPHPALLLALLRQGAPSFLTFLATGIGIALITHYIARHGAAAVAAYGIGLRLEQLILLPSIGLTAAAVSVVGQNRGAGHLGRVRLAALTALAYGVVVMGAGALGLGLLRYQALRIFTDDPRVLALGADYLAVAVWAAVPYAMILIGAAILQGLREPMFGFAVGVIRQIVAPPLLLGPLDLRYGLGGIFVGLLLTSWTAAIATVAWVLWRLGRLGRTGTVQAA